MDWSYRACIADSVSTGRVFALDILKENSTVTAGDAPNGGLKNFDLAVIQGFEDCAYAGLVVRTIIF